MSRLTKYSREMIAFSACKSKYLPKYNAQIEILNELFENSIRISSNDSFFRSTLNNEQLNFVKYVDSFSLSYLNGGRTPKNASRILFDSTYGNWSFSFKFKTKIYGIDLSHGTFNIPKAVQEEVDKLFEIIKETEESYLTCLAALQNCRTIKQLNEQLPWAKEYIPESMKPNTLPISQETIEKANEIMKQE